MRASRPSISESDRESDAVADALDVECRTHLHWSVDPGELGATEDPSSLSGLTRRHLVRPIPFGGAASRVDIERRPKKMVRARLAPEDLGEVVGEARDGEGVPDLGSIGPALFDGKQGQECGWDRPSRRTRGGRGHSNAAAIAIAIASELRDSGSGRATARCGVPRVSDAARRVPIRSVDRPARHRAGAPPADRAPLA